MLSILVKVAAELSDCSEITVGDVTDDQTITDPDTLETVPDTDKLYGGDNPARDSLGVFLIAQKVNSDNTYTNLVVDNSNAGLVTSWTIDVTKDGWIRFIVIGVPNWDSALEYSIGDYVHYDSQIYKAKEDSLNSNPFANVLNWEPVSDIYTIKDEEGIYSTTISDILTCRARTCVGKAGIAVAEECCDDCKDKDLAYFLMVSAQLSALEIARCEGRYRTGEKVARQLEVNCKSGKCKKC